MFHKHLTIGQYLFILFTVVFLTSCSSDEPGNGVRSIEMTHSEHEVVMQLNNFSWRLFSEVSKCNPAQENILISPLSVGMNLALCANLEEDEESRDEILQALGLSGVGIQPINECCYKLSHQLCNLDKKVAISLANSAWFTPQWYPNEKDVSNFADYYNCKLRKINDATLMGDVNNWCNKATNGVIPQMLSSAPNWEAAFVSAACFSGEGEGYHIFLESAIVPDVFVTEEGKRQVTQFLCPETYSVQFYEDANVQMINIPSGDSTFIMTFILPKENLSLNECIGHFTDGSWNQKFPKFKRSRDVRIPKIDIHSDIYDLEPAVYNLGIKKLKDKYPTAISTTTAFKIKLTTKFEITEGYISYELPIPPRLDFTRPFIYVLSEQSTHTIVFIGRFDSAK